MLVPDPALVDEAALIALAQQSIEEGLYLEFKEAIDQSPSKRMELVEDITSFANAAGGDLLLGVPQKRGPGGEKLGMGEPVGLDERSPDEFRQYIENLLRDGTQPQVRGVRFYSIPLSNGRTVFWLRIPRSWTDLHIVELQRQQRFVSRNASGKYQMDFSQIRDRFLNFAGIKRQMAEFRLERVSRIAAGETPVELDPHGKVVLHLLPQDGFENGGPTADSWFRQQTLLSPLFNQTRNQFFNFDGFVVERDGLRAGEKSRSYAQTFRNGTLEAVDGARMIGPRENDPTSFTIAGRIEAFLLTWLDKYLKAYAALEVQPPLYAAISFVGVRAYGLEAPSRLAAYQWTARPLDRDMLLLPEIEINSTALNLSDLSALMRPAFDALHQAFGFQKCGFYRETGEYVDIAALLKGEFSRV